MSTSTALLLLAGCASVNWGLAMYWFASDKPAMACVSVAAGMFCTFVWASNALFQRRLKDRHTINLEE